MATRSPRARLAFLLIFGLGGTAALVALGTWQVQRLGWKQDLIAGLETRLAAAPVPLPETPTEARDEYLRVEVEGRFAPGALHVLTSEKPWGPGYRVVSPFETSQGRRVMVDRGYIEQADKEADLEAGAASVTGALLWPQETGGFVPEPDLAANIWFGRDAEAMSRALETEPILIVAETATGEWPKPRPVTVELPNDHLQYAVTWFSLAAIWMVMTLVLARRLRRRGEV